MRIFCTMQKDSHIFQTKITVYRYLNFNKMLTNNVINFEQLAPGLSNFMYFALNTGKGANLEPMLSFEAKRRKA